MRLYRKTSETLNNNNKKSIFLQQSGFMRILIKCPSFNKHGGIRVLVEHANGLSSLGHEVYFQSVNPSQKPDWIDINPNVEVIFGQAHFSPTFFDVIIAGSPFLALDIQAQYPKTRSFMLLQMCEELFLPDNEKYVQACLKAYHLPMPIIGISRWNQERVYNVHGRSQEYEFHYIGNGVGDEFTPGEKDPELTILVEGWIGYNHAKDTNAIGPKVARRLKQDFGAKVIAYSQFPKDTTQFGKLPFLEFRDVPDEYYTGPDTETIVRLNQRAHILLKASHFDARSCAPVEAMKCGTPTARAIDLGDDDLIHRYNSLRCAYNEQELYAAAAELIENVGLRNELIDNGLKYAETELSWPRWTGELEKIISK